MCFKLSVIYLYWHHSVLSYGDIQKWFQIIPLNSFVTLQASMCSLQFFFNIFWKSMHSFVKSSFLCIIKDILAEACFLNNRGLFLSCPQSSFLAPKGIILLPGIEELRTFGMKDNNWAKQKKIMSDNSYESSFFIFS